MPFLQEYNVLDDLSKGKGAYADVLKVRHIKLGYVRAIRVLKDLIVAEEGKDPKESELYQKFMRECKVLLQLGNGSHPNIVRIYKPDLRENKAFVEMDYVKGKNINEFMELNRNFVPYEEVVRMATQISSALAYCHEDVWLYRLDRNKFNISVDPEDKDKVIVTAEERKKLIQELKIIHNDIHSGNIMRREDGNFVLLDFGLSFDGDEVVLSSSRQNGGALAFKPPEKWNNKTITEQSDIYSFGIVLYQCLAGRVPFLRDANLSKEKAEHKLAEAHKEQLPPPIEAIRKEFFEKKFPGRQYERDYPQWLEDVIMKCLSKNREDRFRNGKELYEFIMRQEDNIPENRIAKLSDEKSELESKNEELYRAVHSFEKELEQSNSSLASVQEQLDSEKKKKKRMNFLCGILILLCGLCGSLCTYLSINRPAASNGENSEYEQLISNKNDTIGMLKNQIQDDKSVIEAQNEKIALLEKDGVDSSTDMSKPDAWKEKFNEKKNEVDKLTEQLSAMETDLREKKSELASKENQLSEKKSELTSKEKQLNEKKSEVASLKEQLKKKDELIESQKNEINVLRED